MWLLTQRAHAGAQGVAEQLHVCATYRRAARRPSLVRSSAVLLKISTDTDDTKGVTCLFSPTQDASKGVIPVENYSTPVHHPDLSAWGCQDSQDDSQDRGTSRSSGSG